MVCVIGSLVRITPSDLCLERNPFIDLHVNTSDEVHQRDFRSAIIQVFAWLRDQLVHASSSHSSGMDTHRAIDAGVVTMCVYTSARHLCAEQYG